MVYGDGYTSGNDVVGHELTHGVTYFESNLFYYMQSGALDESLSDIWGEYIDQTNGKGNDSPGVRWLMGEDVPIGTIRGASATPLSLAIPDSISSPNYKCNPQDNGMVHSNSGVNNEATVLMTDGGSLHGKTVTALSRSADGYGMATRLITSAAEYQDVLDDALRRPAWTCRRAEPRASPPRTASKSRTRSPPRKWTSSPQPAHQLRHGVLCWPGCDWVLFSEDFRTSRRRSTAGPLARTGCETLVLSADKQPVT